MTLSDVGAAYADYQEKMLFGRGAGGGMGQRQGQGQGMRHAMDTLPMRDPGSTPAPAVASAMNAASAENDRFFDGLTYLGQLDRTYLVCEAAGELVLLDQHAAHERIVFQRLREAHAANRPQTQRLLFPLQLELDPTQAAAPKRTATRSRRSGSRWSRSARAPGRSRPHPRSCPTRRSGNPARAARRARRHRGVARGRRPARRDVRHDRLSLGGARRRHARARRGAGAALVARRCGLPRALSPRPPGAPPDQRGRDRQTFRTDIAGPDERERTNRCGGRPDSVGEECLGARDRPRRRAPSCSPPIRSRSTAAWTSAPPRRPPRSGRACRTTCSTWPRPTSR